MGKISDEKLNVSLQEQTDHEKYILVNRENLRETI